MSLSQKNSKKQGDVGVATAVYCLSHLGYTVSIPLTDSQEYDLVVDIDNKLYRVQVKTTTYKPKGKSYQAGLRINGGNRSGTGLSKKLNKNGVDYLFVATSDGDNYFIPIDFVEGSSSINLSKKYENYKINMHVSSDG